MTLCSSCSYLTLQSLITTDTQTQKYGYKLADSLTTVRQRADSCDLCKLVEECIRVIPLPPPSTKKDTGVWASGVTTTDPPTVETLTGIIVSCNGRSATLDIYGNPPAENTVKGQAIVPSIDAAKVAAFIKQKEQMCKTTPHARCQKTLTGQDLDSDYRPPRLWNIKEKRLVEDGLEMRSSSYTALSYTWGTSEDRPVDPFKLTTKNREERKQGQGLPDPLLEVYKRAFDITTQLGEEYIWVDSLCIIQDDGADQATNFENHVHKVYQNARVTICAIFKEPSVDPFNLRLVPSITEQAMVINNKYCIAKRVSHPAVDIGTGNLEGRPYWAGRGWTFQERVLASFCVYLTNHQLYWECHSSLVEERGGSHLPMVYKRSMQQPQDLWPSMVRDYSNRELGRATDKIPAITGIAKQLSGDPDSGFLKAGFMPQRVGRDLLWESDAGGVPLQRRINREGQLIKQPPPWSWAYWNGAIDFETYLQTATLSDKASYSLVSPEVFSINGAQYTELQAGSDTTDIGGPTDIVYTVRHRNVLSLMDKEYKVVGWGAFDTIPNADGKKVFCVSVSTTTWTDPTKPNQEHKAANVLLLNRLGLSSNTFGRAGVGQIWDDGSVVWTNDISAFSVTALEKPNPTI